MILDKLRGFLGFKKKGDEKEIVISCERLERRVAFLEGGRLEEFSIERDSDRQISGSVYKGKVKNLEPGLKAMFVDIGLDKNAFLHYWDAIPVALDAGVEAIERHGGKRKNQKRITANDIPKLYPPGSDIIVQVTKGPIGTKGAADHHEHQFAGPLPRADALFGSVRYFTEDRGPERAAAAATDFDRARSARRHGRDHPHRG